MIVLQYLAAALCALSAACWAVVFTLSFAAWLFCEPAARRGVFRPRPWLALAFWTILSTATYVLLPS